MPAPALKKLLFYAACIAVLVLPAALAAQPDVSTYPLGATIVEPQNGGGVVFRVWAPNATRAQVPGEFNNWSTGTASDMTHDPATDYWSRWVPNAQEGDAYKFRLSNSIWKNDPWSRNTDNSLGDSIVADDGSDYPWQATDWQTPDMDEIVIYQLHVGSFSGNGDGVANYPGTFRDVVDAHVDDILATGANMVKILPVKEFAGDRSWGYNPSHLFAPESNYGTPDDLRYLVDTLHQNGVGVLLDVVYNHIGPSDNNLWEFDGPANIYFYDEECARETQWGPRPDYSEQEVADFIAANAAYWHREFRFDGLRVDATRAMRGYCNENGAGWNLMQRIVNESKAVNPRAIIIAEDLPNDGAVTTPQAQGGAGYDAQWCDPFNDTFRAELSGTTPDMNAIAFVIANSGFGRPNREAVKYVESHDEAGNGQRLTTLIDPADPFSDRAVGLNKVSGALTLLSPGIPMFLMGQEFMEDKPFDDGPGDRIWWGFLDTYGGVRDLYRAVGNLRTTRPSLFADAGVQITHVNDAADVIAFQRFDNSGDVTFVVANFSDTAFSEYLLGVPSAGEWHELVNSDAAKHLGGGMTNGTMTATPQSRDGLLATLDVSLAPYAIAVFSKTPLPPEPGAGDLWVLN